MPRLPRIDVAGIAQHIVQRGNNRLPCFLAEGDYIRYRDDLRELALKFECSVHAYLLMTNPVHLLMTPAHEGSIARVMQGLGRRFVRYFNDRWCRTGTLWEGRYKSCAVDSVAHLLACYRYIELNPVRAAMVAHPAEYRWSSYAANTMGRADPLIAPHATYLSLGASTNRRCEAYVALVDGRIDEAEIARIRQYMQRQQALGSGRFQDAIEAQVKRRVRPGRVGRPRNAKIVPADRAPPDIPT